MDEFKINIQAYLGKNGEYNQIVSLEDNVEMDK